MNKRKFQQAVDQLLENDVEGLSWDEKLALIRKRIVEREKKRNLNAEKRGKPWTDEELRLVLMTAPTAENCMLLARTFRRRYGSIEQIFRWTAERSSIQKKRPNDSFLKRLKRIATEVGWRAT